MKMADDTQDINIVFTSRADAPYNIDHPVEKERERKRIKREGKHSVVLRQRRHACIPDTTVISGNVIGEYNYKMLSLAMGVVREDREKEEREREREIEKER